MDDEARWDTARRLLHDDTLKPEGRCARLLLLPYAQWPAAISRLTNLIQVRSAPGTHAEPHGREAFREFPYPTPPLHPDVHKITAAGAAFSAHLSVLRAPLPCRA
ncbi:hypothetical protein [Streptomyces sp. NPDC127084]|uniref:hypothetical protein n=1 Tax=Streptomyces sp. NPDC127084 TaxID=3347133 RepID=UPI003652381C